MMRKIGMIMRLGFFITGVIVSFIVYPMFTDLFAAGFTNIIGNLLSWILFIIVLMILFALPYVKMAGFGLLLGLLLNYLYLTGGI